MLDDDRAGAPAPEATPGDGATPAVPSGPSIGRRSFLGFLVAGPVLVTAATVERRFTGGHAGGSGRPQTTKAATEDALLSSVQTMTPIPSPPQFADITDLGDLIILAGAPTDSMITLTIQPDGTVDFVMPREDNGQGVLTAVAMIIADELDVPLTSVNVTLADAEPALLFNQITGGSSTIRSLWQPLRTAAALARGQLLAAAASEWNLPIGALSASDGVVTGPAGRSASYGSLSVKAASRITTQAVATPKDASQYKLIGTPVSQLANPSIVTGEQIYATDLKVPGAKPTMVRRAPTQGGTLVSFNNPSVIKAMPGVLTVAAMPFGVAIRGETFGQVIDAVIAVDATFAPSPIADQSDKTIFATLEAATPPLTLPPVSVGVLGAQTIEMEFEWSYVNHAPLEPNVAVADVRPDRAEIWAPLQNPIAALQQIALDVGLPQSAVTVHVLRGGGSFGRTLFFDAAEEAAQISKAMGQPVKLMWHRTNDMRQGRGHPHTYHRLGAAVVGGSVLAYQHLVSCVQTDINPGLGEIFTYEASKLPPGEMGFDQTLFLTTVTCPYNFGVVTELLDEVDLPLATASWRSVYSYDTRCSEEILVDQIAKAMGEDPLAFRLAFLKDDQITSLLKTVARVGNWGRPMAPGTAQGICANSRDRGYGASLVEVDATDPSRPRVTKAVIAVDAVLPINPRGIEGQQLSGLSDAISVVFTARNKVVDGLPLADGWNNFGQTLQGNYPRDVTVIVVPRDGTTPAGIGESGVPNTAGAIANAYIRATGRIPTTFPINPVKEQGLTPRGEVAQSDLSPLPPPGDYYNY